MADYFNFETYFNPVIYATILNRWKQLPLKTLLITGMFPLWMSLLIKL